MKKNKKNEEEMENFFDVIVRNYKTVPGFKILLKLGLYFIFIGALLVIVIVGNSNSKDLENKTTTTVEAINNSNYRDMIMNLQDVKKETITINNVKLSLDIGESIDGYEESENEIKKVVLKDNKLYEITSGEEVLSSVIEDATYFNPTEVLKYLLNNKSIKYDNEEVFYKYDFLTVYIKDEKISKIVVNNSYEINYN